MQFIHHIFRTFLERAELDLPLIEIGKHHDPPAADRICLRSRDGAGCGPVEIDGQCRLQMTG